MVYRVEINGKIFEGSDIRRLLELAVQARRRMQKKGNVIPMPSPPVRGTSWRRMSSV